MKHFESFESNRWIWRVNLALQVVLVFALVGVVNFIGMMVWARFDLTKNRAYSLSGEARSYVENLRVPVHVIVTLSGNTDDAELDQAFRDVSGLLREFEYAARGNNQGSVNVSFVNVFQNRAAAESLGLVDTPNVVVFESGGRRRIIGLNEIYVTSGRERSQFVGEKAFASALLDVTSEDTGPVLYFLTGHGEIRTDNTDPDRGASRLEAELRVRAYETQELDLSVTRRVPDDAGLVLVLAPQTPIPRAQQEMLREYLAKHAGHVLLALDPGRDHGLDDLLFEWGILVDDVIAVETDARFRTESGDLLVKNMAADHPITHSLAEAKIPVVMDLVRSVRPDPGRPLDDALIVTELLRTSSTVLRNQPASWGEFNYRQPPPLYDAGRDLIGPIGLATVAERRIDERLGVNVQGGRLIVFGGSDFLTNNRLGVANFTLLFNAINWALNLEQRVKIPPRPIERLKLNLSEQQLFLLGLAVVLGPPLAATLFGLAVFLARRR